MSYVFLTAAGAALDSNCVQLTALQVAAGFITWMNVLKLFALIVGAVCFMYLFGRAVIEIIMAFAKMPIAFYEVIGFALAFALLAAPALLQSADPNWMIVPGGRHPGGDHHLVG